MTIPTNEILATGQGAGYDVNASSPGALVASGNVATQSELQPHEIELALHTVLDRIRGLELLAGPAVSAPLQAAAVEVAEVVSRLRMEKGDLDQRRASLAMQASELRAAYDGACRLVAQMHQAAVGDIVGPKIGVVEDVLMVRLERDNAQAEAAAAARFEQMRLDAYEERVAELESVLRRAVAHHRLPQSTVGTAIKRAKGLTDKLAAIGEAPEQVGDHDPIPEVADLVAAGVPVEVV